MSFYPFVRPALFALDPETAHRLTFRALDTLHRVGLAGLIRQSIPNDPRQAMSIRFPNPVGLAAGLDKDGRHIDALGDLGFGFLEIGTVTPRPQSGNPRPRMFRLPEANALINRMGFNNDGVHALVQRVRASRFYKRGGVLGINIGKNATTPLEQSADDYVECLKHVHAIAS
ncbi:MAG TPA: dihydroorotate dehydrogenase (quinone), partial [Burkholderiaceae bacterium]|nr:dihydroorotate dehydrogenase (quinone) [Burkholderiaceae bacterium]